MPEGVANGTHCGEMPTARGRHRASTRRWGLSYPPPMLTLTVNGETRTTPLGATVASLVDELGLDVRQIAIEHNREILPRKDYPTTALANGDRLEIVTFVGGG